MNIEKIIDYLILKNLSENSEEYPMNQKMKIAYIKAKIQYSKLSESEKTEIIKKINNHERGG